LCRSTGVVNDPRECPSIENPVQRENRLTNPGHWAESVLLWCVIRPHTIPFAAKAAIETGKKSLLQRPAAEEERKSIPLSEPKPSRGKPR